MMAGGDQSRWDVLVVDDEEVVRNVAVRVLGAEGLRVVVAQDAGAALAHAALDSCRVVLCDLMLPDRSGLDLLREIRQRRQDVALICTTGYATRDQMELAEQAGATVFLPKPFDEDELLSAVRRALDEGASPPSRRR